MKPKLKTLTWSDFDEHEPCYSPQERYGDFSGTILDILQDARIPADDKIWSLTCKGIVDDRALRLFAVRCARQVQHLMEDERSFNALEIAEKYANGLYTGEKLVMAWEVARMAACAEAWEVEGAEAEEAAWESQVKIAINLINEIYEP